MDLTRTLLNYGTWSWRTLHALAANRFLTKSASSAPSAGTPAKRASAPSTLTADVYSAMAARMRCSGKALASLPRDSYALVGMIGHDFYSGQRDGSKGFPRFTHPQLRSSRDYADYVRMATEKELERCGVDKFDCLMLHNPDSIGYTSDAVWNAMAGVQEAGLTEMLGVAPGPANGFSLDLILNFERFGALLDWAMIILSPMEPWPELDLALPAAEEHEREAHHARRGSRRYFP